jgi:hypothetical protein
VTVDVVFNSSAVAVEFVEDGLPTGSTWTVTVTNLASGAFRTAPGTGPSIVLSLAPGDYAWSTVGPGGYHPDPGSGTLVVPSNGVAPIAIAFVPAASTTSPYATPLVIDAALTIAVVLVGLRAAWGVVQYRNTRDRTVVREWLDRFHQDAGSGPSDPTNRRGP